MFTSKILITSISKFQMRKIKITSYIDLSDMRKFKTEEFLKKAKQILLIIYVPVLKFFRF